MERRSKGETFPSIKAFVANAGSFPNPKDAESPFPVPAGIIPKQIFLKTFNFILILFFKKSASCFNPLTSFLP